MKRRYINRERQISKVSYVRLFTGFAGLSLGVLLYLSDRPPESTWFVQNYLHSSGEALHRILPDLFGTLDRNIASFLHTFSFTMITGAFVGESKTGCFMAAFIWCVVNVLFEVGQYFDTIVIRFIPDWFEQYKFLKTVDDYFIAGSFDLGDIVAIFAGALVGFTVLVYQNRQDSID